jgi:hypothetical protein
VTRRFGPAARALLAATTLALTALMASIAPAAATPADPPSSGDPRATAYPGNAVTCEDAGLDGEIIEVEFQIDDSNRFLDIISVPSDVELTGIVVKGSNAYNVYGPEADLDLHAPLNPGGIAGISHWYVCGQEISTPTETPTDSPLKDDETLPEESPTEEGEADEADVAPASTTDTEAAADTTPGGGASGSSDLANTGFSGRGLLLAGSGLLILGLGLVFAVRASRRRGDNTSG